MTAFADAGTDFVLCLGDLVDDCDDDARKREEIRKLTKMIRTVLETAGNVKTVFYSSAFCFFLKV